MKFVQKPATPKEIEALINGGVEADNGAWLQANGCTKDCLFHTGDETHGAGSMGIPAADGSEVNWPVGAYAVANGDGTFSIMSAADLDAGYDAAA